MHFKVPWTLLALLGLAPFGVAAETHAQQPLACPPNCTDKGIVYTRQDAGHEAGQQISPTSSKAARFESLPLPSITNSDRYSAQRKPRVAVVTFVDNNKDAKNQIYSSSVEAMLVTFLKRKSQFVVVERRDINDVLNEWKLKKATNIKSLDPSNVELLEKIDAILMGSVTMIEAPSSVDPTPKSGSNSSMSSDRETRVEVDLKALGVADGRIIAAAKSSGPVHCMRAIVERLGVALEEGFLRPYYGSLQFSLSSPNNVRIYLTPILLDNALDEEKPPVEHGESIIQGARRDSVETWTADPTSYTIRDLLGGWYTFRLERPGYTGVGIENGNQEWQAREVGGKVQVLYLKRDGGAVPVNQAPAELRRFVIHVDLRGTTLVDGDRLGLSFTSLKQGGSLATLVRRQFLDKQFDHVPQRVILIGKEGLDINRPEPPVEYTDDQTCDLFEEKNPKKFPYGKTRVAAGDTFDFDGFQGGDLIIEDYKGEKIPSGKYQIAFWEPNYQLLQGWATVSPGDEHRLQPASLVRETFPVDLEATGAHKPFRAQFTGKTTGNHSNQLLNFERLDNFTGLPVDSYLVSTNIPGLQGWRREVELFPRAGAPPIYDPKKDAETDRIKAEQKEALRKAGQDERAAERAVGERWFEMPLTRSESEEFEDASPASHPRLRIKTRLSVGGHLTALGSTASFESDEFYLDNRVAPLLEHALGPEVVVRRAAKGFFARLMSFGKPSEATPAAAATTHKPATSGATSPDPSPPDPTRLGLEDARATTKSTGAANDLPSAPADVLPKEPAALRSMLARRLQDLDLLVLDDEDMRRIRENPEVAAIVRRYVESGGAVYAFISEPGEYGPILGKSLTIKEGRKSRRFEVAQGDIPTVRLKMPKKKVSLKSRRPLLQPDLASDRNWRIMAFTKERSGPRILEQGGREEGGYVAVWLDQPSLFQSRFLGNRLPAIEQTRATVEGHVVDWARFLMYRRYDSTGNERRKAEQILESGRTALAEASPAVSLGTVSASSIHPATVAERLKDLDELRKQGLLSPEEYDRKRSEILSKL